MAQPTLQIAECTLKSVATACIVYENGVSLRYYTDENRYKVEGGVARGNNTCQIFAGRMWSGEAREQYASEISNRKLP